MRAYVTGSDDARSAMRACYDLTPRRATSLWPAHERREGLAQHAPPVGGNLKVVARVKAADTYDALQAPWRRGCQRSRQRTTRRSPPCRRGRAQTARAWTVAPLPLPWGCTGRIGPASGARTVTSLRTR